MSRPRRLTPVEIDLEDLPPLGGPHSIPPPMEQSGVRRPVLPRGLEFVGPLGSGSIGVVMAARVESTGQLVAVKMLSPEHATHPEQRTRMFAEAIAASRLSSQHVAKVLDVGELSDGAPYIVMEYLEGQTLDEVLRTRGPLPAPFAVECIMQVLDALGEAHALGLIHRDVKPSNLFLVARPDGAPFVKVLDFGLVKDVISTKMYGRITTDGNVHGTPAYMAPEQLDPRQDVDSRVDVWAVGATLFELLTGDVPFSARSIPQILARIARDPVPPIRAKRPDVSHRLERIVARCLSKSPDARYSSAAELALALGAELF
jgi:serine/threonine-protein kinase